MNSPDGSTPPPAALVPPPADLVPTLGGFLDWMAKRYADAEAIAFDDPLAGGARTSWSYRDLHRHAWDHARALSALGVTRGERVGLLLGNRPEFVAALFGTAIAGALPVALSTFSTAAELAQLLRHSQVGRLFTQSRIAGRHLPALLPDNPSIVPFLRDVVVLGDPAPGTLAWSAFLATGTQIDPALAEARAAVVAPGDLGVAVYTSGTTAQPKGVLHYQSTVVIQSWWQAQIFGRYPGVRVGSPFPLFWSAGLITVLGATLAAGGTYVAQETFVPDEALAVITRERIAEWYGFPTHTAALAELPAWPHANLSSMTRTRGYFEFDVHPHTNPDPDWRYVVAYGMSESATLLTGHRASAPPEMTGRSAGPPLPGMVVRIVDPVSGAALPPGESGEICARGPLMMPHYLGQRPEDSFDADGFFHTGDLGHLNAEGELVWSGRIKDLIKTGGANVAPAEIEEATAAIEAIRFCRVIGVPDARLGEQIVLCAVSEDGVTIGEDAVRAHLRARLAAYKVPRRVLFFAPDDFPLTPSGKVRDSELHALVAARLA